MSNEQSQHPDGGGDAAEGLGGGLHAAAGSPFGMERFKSAIARMMRRPMLIGGAPPSSIMSALETRTVETDEAGMRGPLVQVALSGKLVRAPAETARSGQIRVDGGRVKTMRGWRPVRRSAFRRSAHDGLSGTETGPRRRSRGNLLPEERGGAQRANPRKDRETSALPAVPKALRAMILYEDDEGSSSTSRRDLPCRAARA